MSGSRYARDVDLSDANNAHTMAILSVPPGSNVLDIGCADGSVARMLVKRGCRVWGVETDKSAAAEAERYCEQVLVGDVEQINLRTSLDLQFDVVLLLDVLEHLREPEETLRAAAALLAPGGRLLASIPNVAHAAVKLHLLRGTFTYTDVGLLDRTHLRFFDQAAVEKLFREADLTVVEELRVTRLLSETEIEIDPDSFAPEVIKEATADSESETYQFVVVAQPRGELAPSDPQLSLTTHLQRRVQELEKDWRDRVERARQLEAVAQRAAELETMLTEREATLGERFAELETMLTEREATLGERVAELDGVHDQLKLLRLDLMVKEKYIAELRVDTAELEDLRTEMASARHELAHLRETENRVLNSAGYRLVDRTYDTLGKYPGLRRMARQFVRAVARTPLGARRPR